MNIFSKYKGSLLLILLIGILTFYLLPSYSEENINEIFTIDKIDISNTYANSYLMILNEDEQYFVCLSDKQQVLIPMQNSKIISTQGDHAYVMKVEGITYKGPFKFKSYCYYNIFVPDKNKNTILYIENQPCTG